MKRDSSPPMAERLVAVATDLFYRRGFRAVGVDEIVAQTGVAKPTLYRHFASKDALGAACLTKLGTDDLAQLAKIADDHPGDPIGQVRAIVQLAATRISDLAYRGWPMSNAEVEIADPQHPARRVCEQYKVRVRAHLQDLAQDADFHDPAVLADGLLLLIEGAAASWHAFGADGPARHLSANCEILMEGHRQRDRGLQ